MVAGCGGKGSAYSDLMGSLILYWMDRRWAQKLIKPMEVLLVRAEESGSAWLAAQAAALLSQLSGKNEKCREKAEAFFERTGMQNLVELIQPESRWQQALSALINLKRSDAAPAADAGKSSRMIWLLEWEEKYGSWDLSPREQVLSSQGCWSKGRRIALKRLYYERDRIDFLTPQDQSVCAAIEEESRLWRGYPEVSYHFRDKALKALAGHHLVFLADSPDVPVEIVMGRTELLLNNREGGQFEITFSHEVKSDDALQLVRESPTRLKLIETNEDVRRIAKIIGKGLKVPVSGKTQLLEAINSISPMLTVHSQVAGIGAEAEERPADPTPRIHLRPLGVGLRLEILVQPFAPEGSCFRPGEGGETVISEIGGRLLRTRRELDREKRLAEQVVSACPTLTALGESDGFKWTWVLKAPEDCLEVLLELKAVTSPLAVEWPEGESFRIRQQAGLNRFFMHIQKKKDWFSVSGELKLDDGLVLSMDRLLSLLEGVPGRFVHLENGEFLALTREFRKRLDDMAAYSTQSGKTRRFHPLAALSLEEMVDTVLAGFTVTAIGRLSLNGSMKPGHSLLRYRPPSRPSCAITSLRGFAGWPAWPIGVLEPAWPTTWALEKPSRLLPSC